jgi:hypothetical protein
MRDIIVGDVALDPSVEVTRVKCAGIKPGARVFLQAHTDGAVQAEAYVDPSDTIYGEFTVWHNAGAQAEFGYLVFNQEE